MCTFIISYQRERLSFSLFTSQEGFVLCCITTLFIVNECRIGRINFERGTLYALLCLLISFLLLGDSIYILEWFRYARGHIVEYEHMITMADCPVQGDIMI